MCAGRTCLKWLPGKFHYSQISPMYPYKGKALKRLKYKGIITKCNNAFFYIFFNDQFTCVRRRHRRGSHHRRRYGRHHH
jgi:hypothetical protein